MSETLALRTMTEADLEVADAIARDADASPHSRVDELRRQRARQPAGWVLATRDGRPAGMGGTTDYGPFAYIGLMAVVPDVQRRSIGMEIMKKLLGWLAGRGGRAVDRWGHFGHGRDVHVVACVQRPRQPAVAEGGSCRRPTSPASMLLCCGLSCLPCCGGGA
jgi:hypothetical protein